MTVLCVAVGSPMPTISLYVSGELIRQEKTRHMVALLPNVTRTMNHITCSAENGYGMSSQASRNILIGRQFFSNYAKTRPLNIIHLLLKLIINNEIFIIVNIQCSRNANQNV